MSTPTTQLAYLRSTGTSIDCDTFSSETYTSLSSHGGPFTGCTSNQAIAYSELMHLRTTKSYEALLLSSLEFARLNLSHYQALPPDSPDTDLTIPQLAVEAIMVQLSVSMAPAINPGTGGDLHVQTNTAYSFSTQKTIANAVRVKELFEYFLSQQYPERSKLTLCVKIPTNYPSMLAARTLRQKFGIRCLATAGVSLPQVRLAREVGECEYVAVYVNELGVHFPGEERERLVRRREKAGVGRDGEEDLVEAMGVVRDGHEWLVRHGGAGGTKMMPASLTSAKECLQLAGVAHITIPPGLLLQLENTPYAPETTPKSYLIPPSPPVDIGSGAQESYLDGATAFEKDFAEARGGRANEMFNEAVRIFGGFQEKLEEIFSRL